MGGSITKPLTKKRRNDANNQTNADTIKPHDDVTTKPHDDVEVKTKGPVGSIYKKMLQMPVNKVFTWESIEQVLKRGPQNVQTFENDLLGACPIIHTRVLPLLRDFIRVKQSHGNQREKEFFAKATPATMIQRFLQCRPVVFMTGADTSGADTFLLRNSHRSVRAIGMG